MTEDERPFECVLDELTEKHGEQAAIEFCKAFKAYLWETRRFVAGFGLQEAAFNAREGNSLRPLYENYGAIKAIEEAIGDFGTCLPENVAKALDVESDS